MKFSLLTLTSLLFAASTANAADSVPLHQSNSTEPEFILGRVRENTTKTKLRGRQLYNSRDPRYNELRQIMAHNAMSNFNQPGSSITDLLNAGVRGLALDLWEGSGGMCPGLSDPICFNHKFMFFPESPTSVRTILYEIRNFLRANPNEIVTIVLENNVGSYSNEALFREYVRKYVTDKDGNSLWWEKGGDFEPFPDKGEDWPRVSEMVAKNNRLVIFYENNYLSRVPATKDHFSENMYGDMSLDVNEQVRGRRSDGSRRMRYGWSLSLMNRFGMMPSGDPAGRNAGYNFVAHVLDFTWQNGGRWPNFISLDNVINSRVPVPRHPGANKDDWVGGAKPWRYTGNDSSVNTYDKFVHHERPGPQYYLKDVRVVNEPGHGITKITPVWTKNFSERAFAIKIVEKGKYGVVNMCVKQIPTMHNSCPWKTDNEKNDEDGATYHWIYINDLPGIDAKDVSIPRIAYREEGGHGVVDVNAWFEW